MLSAMPSAPTAKPVQALLALKPRAASIPGTPKTRRMIPAE